MPPLDYFSIELLLKTYEESALVRGPHPEVIAPFKLRMHGLKHHLSILIGQWAVILTITGDSCEIYDVTMPFINGICLNWSLYWLLFTVWIWLTLGFFGIWVSGTSIPYSKLNYCFLRLRDLFFHWSIERRTKKPILAGLGTAANVRSKFCDILST